MDTGVRVAWWLLLLTLAPVASAATLPSAPSAPHAPREVLVVMAPEGTLTSGEDGQARGRSAPLALALLRHGLTQVEPLRHSTSPAARGVQVLRLTSDLPEFDPLAAAAELRGTPGVLAASPNLRLRLHRAPNDPRFPSQWHLSNSAAGVQAQQGWNRETGVGSVTIGIMDTGVDIGHPDLASKIWVNTAETPGNGLDDDLDGYIDDLNGWDFGDHDADPSPTPLIDPNVGIDEGWHGTFVAGLAAGATNNSVGIAGVAWGCRIVPLKVSDVNGDIALSSLVEAFDYAIAHQVSVLNMSLGTSDTTARAFFQPLVNEAIAAGVVVVASAGNDGTDIPSYPAACDSVLAVAATNASNQRASFSNWGWYVNIAAPGEAVWSCISRNYEYDETSLLFFELLWSHDGVEPYMTNDGTSFSAPIVAGAAALVRSHFPTLTPKQVVEQLIVQGDVRLYDNPIGPRLNIDRALIQALAVEPVAEGDAMLRLQTPSPNPATGPARFTFALALPKQVRLVVWDAQGRRVRTLLDGPLTSGQHTTVWDRFDDAGRALPAGLYLAELTAGESHAVRRLALVR
ncbi:MAG: S8 family serine peptidase [Candidatus Eisenbacteria bacterium]